MRLLCLIESPNDSVGHIVDELTDSGVYAICGAKTKNGSFWRVALREAVAIGCDRCRDLLTGENTGDVELVLKVPGGAYDVLRTMISAERAVTVVVPAGMLSEERQKAIAELESITDVLRKL